MMKNKLLWILAVLPMLVTAIVVQFMPEKVPMHYDINGNIDRWGSRYEQFIFPVIIILFALFWHFFINHYDKKQYKDISEKEKAAAKNNAKVIYWVGIAMTVMYSVMHYAFMYSAVVEAKSDMTAMAIDSSIIVNVLMGIFLIVIGNILPKAKRNSVVGVRCVWSMENDRTWAESNRIGGIVFMIAGLIIIIESLIIGGIASTLVMLGIIIAAAVVIMICSYKAYKKYK